MFTIETNYRSVPEILDLSNEAIRANEGRIEKNLRASRGAGGVKPALVAVVDSEDFVEIAVVNGNAAQKLGAQVGDEVEVIFSVQ